MGLSDAYAFADFSLTARNRRDRDNLENWGIQPGYGVIYAIQEAMGGPIKIGRAKHMSHRLSVLQIGNPRLLVVLAVDPYDVALLPRHEQQAHDYLAPARIRSTEWFEPVDLVVDFVAAMSRQFPSDPSYIVRSTGRFTPGDGDGDV